MPLARRAQEVAESSVWKLLRRLFYRTNRFDQDYFVAKATGSCFACRQEGKARPDYQPTEEKITTRRATYASRVWHNPRTVIEEIPIPEIGPQDVLVRLKACGICGSDMHLYESDKRGYLLYPGLIKTAVAVGHELSGQVERVASEVSNPRPGHMVVCEEM